LLKEFGGIVDTTVNRLSINCFGFTLERSEDKRKGHFVIVCLICTYVCLEETRN
jgi:hypothetical protein